MDLLSKRYANPCFFLDGMISSGQFCEFIDQLIKTVKKEQEDKSMWEFFLHKVDEGSYNDFVESVKTDEENRSLSRQDMETTVNHAFDILHRFNPTEPGGGTIEK